MAATAYDDDGSSTETEVYFDPAELLAYQQASVGDMHVKQEVVDLTVDDEEEVSKASSESLELPKGSEWSHGAVGQESDVLALEQALALAHSVKKHNEKEESLTADTLKGNKNQTKRRIVSLKGSPPASTVATKPVAVGLRKPLASVVGAPTELEKGLTTQRTPQKKTPETQKSEDKIKERREYTKPTPRARAASPPRRRDRTTEHRQSPSRHRRSPSRRRVEPSKSTPRHGAESPPRRRDDRRTGHRRSPSTHRRSPPRRRVESSRSTPRHRENSPPRRQVDRGRSPSRYRDEHRKLTPRGTRSPPRRDERGKSRARYQDEPRDRADRRRSPSRYRRSPSQHYSRRSRSRSPPTRRVVETRGRSRSRSRHRDSKTADSRQPVSSEKQHRTVEATSTSRQSSSTMRSRSPAKSTRPLQSSNDSRRSRGKSVHPDSRRDEANHRDRHTNKDTTSSVKGKDAILRRDSVRTTQTTSCVDHQRGTTSATSDRHDASGQNASKSNASANRDAHKRDKKVSHPKSTSGGQAKKAHPSGKPTQPAKRKHPNTPEPHSTAKRSKPHAESTWASNDTTKSGATTFQYHSAFEKQVFKLKKQEADVLEMSADATADDWHLANRKRGIAETKERLQKEDYERFCELYNTMKVTKEDLAEYQQIRAFSRRVLLFKQDKAKLQEQQHISLSPEVAEKVLRRLEKEEKELSTENPYMFARIMDDPAQGGKRNYVSNATTARYTNISRGTMNRAHHEYFEDTEAQQQPLQRRAMGAVSYCNRQQRNLPTKARVRVGASLNGSMQHSTHARTSNPAWFLKG